MFSKDPPFEKSDQENQEEPESKKTESKDEEYEEDFQEDVQEGAKNEGSEHKQSSYGISIAEDNEDTIEEDQHD